MSNEHEELLQHINREHTRIYFRTIEETKDEATLAYNEGKSNEECQTAYMALKVYLETLKRLGQWSNCDEDLLVLIEALNILQALTYMEDNNQEQDNL